VKRINLGMAVNSAASVAVLADRLEQLTKDLAPAGKTSASPLGLLMDFHMGLQDLTDLARDLNLPATGAAAVRCKSSINRFIGANQGFISVAIAREIISDVRQLLTTLQDETKEYRTFVVAPAEAKMLDGGRELFGETVSLMFPSVQEDIDAAARCRAFGLWHATVAHSMRIAEVGIEALAKSLNSEIGTNWGDTAAKLRNTLAAVNAKNGDSIEKEWASEAGAHLEFIRKAWRNPAMHPGKTFDREQALSVYDNTRSFMRMLAERLAH
jgi:hypothetical protein